MKNIKNGEGYISRYISENRLRINTLKSNGITEKTIPEIRQCYEKNVSIAKKYNIEIKVLYEYADFLYEQNDYEESYKLGKCQESYYENDESLAEEDVANLKNLLDYILSDKNGYVVTERYYKQSLKIYKR